MNALAIIETAAMLPDGMGEWLDTGRALLTERSRVEWQLADWIADGRERFGSQAPFDFLADELGIAPKRLKLAASVATAFPPSHRDPTLTFDHYESVATLPGPEALSLLKRAKDQHWDDRQTRVEAVKRRAEIGDRAIFTDDDWEHHELMACTRAYNRARPEVRSTFLELAIEAAGKDIDA